MTEDQQTRKRVLLDEMLPRLLARELPGYDVTTVTQAGWTGTVNGQLLLRMEKAGIDAFITADRKMQYQQTLTGRRFGVIVLALGGTKLETLKPFAEAIRLAVARVAPGDVIPSRPAVPIILLDEERQPRLTGPRLPFFSPHAVSRRTTSAAPHL